MAEAFEKQNALDAQGRSWFPITPDDDNDLPHVPKFVHCASEEGGSFVAIGDDGEEGTFYINPGQMLDIRPKRIKSTGLTEGLVLTAIRT